MTNHSDRRYGYPAWALGKRRLAESNRCKRRKAANQENPAKGAF
jgi:hypothetical protein